MRAGQADAFGRLRQQLERRRHDHLQELAAAIQHADADAFVGHQAAQSGLPQFSLCGALPPTTSLRGPDVPSAVAIRRGEREAAKEIIARNARGEAERKQRTHAGVVARRPWTSGPGAAREPGRSAPACCRKPGTAGAAAALADGAAEPGSPRQARHERRPMTQGWERTLLEFYRRAEADEEEQMIATARQGQRADNEARNDMVRKFVFERGHRRREAAITTERRRRDTRAKHEDYRSGVCASLASAQERAEEVALTARSAREERRAQVSKRKQVAEMLTKFQVKQGVLDRVCRLVDAGNLQEAEEAAVASHAAALRDGAAKRTQELASRKTLKRAQQVVRDGDDRDRVEFLMRKQREEEQRRAKEWKRRVKTQRALDAFIHDAQTELVTQEEDLSGLPDIQSYQRSLLAFRELAEEVRAHGAQLHLVGSSEAGEDPLEEAEEEPPSLAMVPAQARVQALFAAAEGSGPNTGYGAGAEETSYADTEGADERSASSGSEAQFFDDGPRRQLPPPLPATAPPPRLPVAVAPMVPGQWDAYGAWPPSSRPATRSRARGAQADAQAPLLRDSQGLASLRMVRRTGPLSH